MADYNSLWRFSRRGKLIFAPIAILAGVNFISFLAISIYLGGDARNGHIKNGHYFLGSHGKYTEVGQTVWNYSYWHATSILATHCSVFIVGALLLYTGDMVLEKKARAV